MYKLMQAWVVSQYNFLQWRKNPRVFITFSLAFVICFLLTDRAVKFAEEYGTIMQIAEAFVWTFGDANNILIISLLLILLFLDMPFLSLGTPFYLIRTTRGVWLFGQIIYICIATLIFMTFILFSTAMLCAHISFVGNQWSETAAMLGYSGAGEKIALPSSVKTMEMSYPYECMSNIFLLMLLYTLLMVSIMLALNIRKGRVFGIVGAFVFSLYGFLLNPLIFQQMFGLPDKLMYKANVAVGWLSPLNQATYYMHNFGYDLLPRLWQTYLIFGIGIAALFFVALNGMKKYSFNFTGSEV